MINLLLFKSGQIIALKYSTQLNILFVLNEEELNMQITINGEFEQFKTNELSISNLLEAKKVESPDMVAVQLNGEFVDKKKYSTTVISENDTLDFLYFMGGGAI
jgi:sulfur carrier protein